MTVHGAQGAPTVRAGTRRTTDPRQVAELWRATGLGLSLVWTVVLLLVVLFWVRVAFLPEPGDDLPGALRVLLAPVALAATLLAGWTLVGTWRIVRRRTSGWDALSVDGALAVAVAALLTLPATLLRDAPTPSRANMVVLAVAGLVTVVVARTARRAFDRVAVGLEPSDDLDEWDEDEPV